MNDTNPMKSNEVKELVQEFAVAISINEINYAVMMCSPNDLDDFIVGFLFTEQVISHRYDIHDIDINLDRQQYTGIINVVVANRCLSQLNENNRQANGNASCGICGVKALAQAMPTLMALPLSAPPDNATLLAVKDDLAQWQTLAKDCGAMHAACLIKDGKIIACREDIGRHNALDKLIGYCINQQLTTGELATLVSSRCSVELVNKAIISNIPILVSLASPSELAVSRARQHNLNLIQVPKYDQPMIYS